MKPLLPNPSSKIAFAALLCFILLGVYFLLFSYDNNATGWACVAIGGVPMLLLLIKNVTARRGQ